MTTDSMSNETIPSSSAHAPTGAARPVPPEEHPTASSDDISWWDLFVHGFCLPILLSFALIGLRDVLTTMRARAAYTSAQAQARDAAAIYREARP